MNWSLNALIPHNSKYADYYLKENREVILNFSTKLLKMISYSEEVLYRGIILKNELVDLVIHPMDQFQYLSFSTDYRVATHFADPISGFGTDLIDVKSQLGEYGYIIKYKPILDEILFHYSFLKILPYTKLIDKDELVSLYNQKEVTIVQPSHPFTDVHAFKNNLLIITC